MREQVPGASSSFDEFLMPEYCYFMKPRQYLHIANSLLRESIKPNFKPQIKLTELQQLTYLSIFHKIWKPYTLAIHPIISTH